MSLCSQNGLEFDLFYVSHSAQGQLDSTSFRKRTSFSQLFQYQPHTYIKTWCQVWTNRINRWRKAEMISIKIWKNPEHYRPVMSVSYLWLNGNHLYGRRRRWISRSRSELFAISGNRRSPTCLTTFLNPGLKNQWYWFCMYFTFLLRVHSMNWCFTHWLAWMIPLKIRFVHWRVHW